MSVWRDVKDTIKCGSGSGGRMKVCSAPLRETLCAPHLCPASSVTTHTSGWCPLTPSHTHSTPTTCCPAHASPTWTSQRGENLTLVLLVTENNQIILLFDVCYSYSDNIWVSFSDPVCGAVPRLSLGFSVLCESAVVYQCPAGYLLQGATQISCDPNTHQWTPQPPTCQGSTQCYVKYVTLDHKTSQKANSPK